MDDSGSGSSGEDILKMLGEAGSIGAVVLLVLGAIIKLIQRNGCTCRVNSCRGSPLVEVDCEEGAPTERFRATVKRAKPRREFEVTTVETKVAENSSV